MKLVKIEWVDVHNVVGGWHDPDELKDFAKNVAYHVTSVGYKVHEDKLCIVLSSRVSPETGEYNPHYGMLERIPKKIIDKITIIKEKI